MPELFSRKVIFKSMAVCWYPQNKAWYGGAWSVPKGVRHSMGRRQGTHAQGSFKNPLELQGLTRKVRLN